MPTRPLIAVVLSLSAFAPRADAQQCPDGGQSCRSARRDPPLDSRTWLVLPFENTAHAQDAELIRQASVNLLYQEMSRWTDVRVVSDDRVADLLRAVPSAAQTRLGLETGLGLARNAGAGNLVLGDYLALGGSAQLNVRVYDVKTRQLVRTVKERLSGLQSATGLDSLTATFGRMARSALNVPAPAGTRSSVGTSSLEAYGAYNAGVVAWRNGFVDSAFTRFQRAIALDPAFPLPRLRMWMMAPSENGVQLDTAARTADVLPPKERMLVTAMHAASLGDFERLCSIGDRMLAMDSTDAEAWFTHANCLGRDNLVVKGPSGGMQFVRSLNQAEAALRRALELDPGHPNALLSLHLVVPPELATTRAGCAVRQVPCPLESRFTARFGMNADTLVTIPEPALPPGTRGLPVRREDVTAWRWRIERLRGIDANYVAANPRVWEGHQFLARMLLALADTAGAIRELDASSYAAHLPGDRRIYYRDRIELELRRGRIEAAGILLDSMFADPTAAVQPQYATAFGQFARDQNPAPDSVRAIMADARAHWTPVYSGILPEHFDSIEARMARVQLNPRTRAGALRLSTILGFYARRTGPALDTSSAENPLVRFQAFFARGDTATARALLTGVDAELPGRPSYWPDDGAWLFTAEGWLELGDSTRSLAVMQDWARRWGSAPDGGFLLQQLTIATATARLFPREWLLFADLSMAANRPRDAREGYRMVVGFWAHGEPIVQPTVARARAALAKLGN